MAEKEKTDEQMRTEIHVKINERLDNIETLIKENEGLHEQRILLKDREIRNLKREIIKLADKAAATYGHNEAARAAVEMHFGKHHSALVREILEEREAILRA